MIPKNITKEHVISAINEIDKEGVPKERRATHYHVKYNGSYYPPKYVISLAYKYVDGHEWDLTRFGGGAETNRFLSKLGFEIECFKKPLTFTMPTKSKTEVSHTPENSGQGYLPHYMPEEYDEGNEEIKEHVFRERNGNLVKNAKRLFKLNNGGRLYCEICDFDFYEKYSEAGADFIECHHTKPVSEMKNGEKTGIKDVIMVCSNCHSMIHRKKPWLTKEELKKMLRK